jgi:hypothetical protein
MTTTYRKERRDSFTELACATVPGFLACCYERVVADVVHEVRSSDLDKVPDEWTELDAVELRDHGLRDRDGRTEVLRS